MKRIVLLSGGVGGAKLAMGLSRLSADIEITVIANVGDDFRHLGLCICPDLDTLLYTLADRNDTVRGWGRRGESWACLEEMRSLGADTWFQLGDRDLALHVLRTDALSRSISLSGFTQAAAAAWGIAARLLPATDDAAPTLIDTDEGVLSFQDYFVRRHCLPRVRAVCLDHARHARPAAGVVEALASADVIIFGPSNPYLSIDPILAVGGIHQAVSEAKAVRVAVSPLIGGRAVKGPLAKLMEEMGLPVTNRQILDHYSGMIDGFLHDAMDEAPKMPVGVHSTNILMQSREDRERVAQATLVLASSLRRHST